MHLHRTIRIHNQLWRHDPATGFLRCTCVILQAGPMQYAAQEVGAQALGKPTVTIEVPQAALSDPFALTSLEGMPIVVGHTWQTTESTDAVGAIAGTPYVNGPDLMGDILVRDAEAVRRIMLPPGDPERLEELSSAFDAMVVFEPSGAVDGRFENIRYNHVALLVAGQARGGSAVRIINEETTIMPTTAFRLPSGRTIRVENEDVAKMEEEVKDQETKAANKVDAAKLAETMASLETAKNELAAKQKEVDELGGQLRGVQEQLNALLDGGIEQAAEALAQEKNDATAVANAHGVQLTDEQKKLRGHALRTAVVNAISPLTDDEKKNEGLVAGMFKAFNARTAKTKVPAGSNIVPTTPVQNAVTPPEQKPDMSDPAVRRARMGY